MEVLSDARKEKRVTALSKKLDLHRRALAKVASDGAKMRHDLMAMAKRLKKLESASGPPAGARKRPVREAKDGRAVPPAEPRWSNLF
jgi:hypothetical protein